MQGTVIVSAQIPDEFVPSSRGQTAKTMVERGLSRSRAPNLFRLLLLSMLLAISANSALAGSTYNCLVTGMFFQEGVNGLGQDGLVYIFTNGTISNPLKCQGSTNSGFVNAFAINPGSTGGAAQLAAILFARAQGRTISFIGNGDNCKLSGGNVEAVGTVLAN